MLKTLILLLVFIYKLQLHYIFTSQTLSNISPLFKSSDKVLDFVTIFLLLLLTYYYFLLIQSCVNRLLKL